MKNLYLRNNPNTRTSSLGVIVAIFLIVTVFGVDVLSGGIVRGVVQETAGYVMMGAATVASVVDANGSFATARALKDENTQLHAALAARDEQALRFQVLVDENESLKRMAQLVETDARGVTARVLSSFSLSPYGTFHIAAGSDDGISTGNLVITEGGFLLGKVSDVQHHTALVTALFAPASDLELKTGEIAFTAYGRGSGNARGEVPRDAVVVQGSPVVAPAFGAYPVGVIASIDAASSSATSILYIRIPVNLDTLSFVYVVPHE